MKAKEALESIMLRAKEGRNKEQQIYIESNYELVKQSLTELEELKKKQEKKDEFLNKINDILALNFSCQEIGIKIKRLFKEEMK